MGPLRPNGMTFGSEHTNPIINPARALGGSDHTIFCQGSEPVRTRKGHSPLGLNMSHRAQKASVLTVERQEVVFVCVSCCLCGLGGRSAKNAWWIKFWLKRTIVGSRVGSVSWSPDRAWIVSCAFRGHVGPKKCETPQAPNGRDNVISAVWCLGRLTLFNSPQRGGGGYVSFSSRLSVHLADPFGPDGGPSGLAATVFGPDWACFEPERAQVCRKRGRQKVPDAPGAKRP